jgi:hypothetical protein
LPKLIITPATSGLKMRHKGVDDVQKAEPQTWVGFPAALGSHSDGDGTPELLRRRYAMETALEALS